MIYSLKLQTAFVLVGILLVLASGLALLKPVALQGWLRGPNPWLVGGGEQTTY